VLLNFINAFLIQTSHTALSNGTATVGEHLARWLLMRKIAWAVTGYRSPTSSYL
jgi:hypothetical protein